MAEQKPKRKCNVHPARTASAFCVKCGTALCEDCVVITAGRPHCSTCAGIQKAYERQETLKRVMDFGSWAEKTQEILSGPLGNKELRRIFSIIIDAVLIIILAIPVSFIFGALGLHFLVPEMGGLSFFLCLYASLLVIGTFYFILFTWRTGKTPGKYLMGLKVTEKNGKPLTLLASFWRWIGTLTAVIWAYIGLTMARWIFNIIAAIASKASLTFLILLWFSGIITAMIFSTGVLITFAGKQKRGFHDILASSIVINDYKMGRRVKR